MLRYNVEMKSFIRRFFALFFITIMMCGGITILTLNVIKKKVVENNQAIIGNILIDRPELEEEIIDVITQGNSKENIYLGKEILSKYNYSNNITLKNEPIINESAKYIFNINWIFICIILILFIILALSYFRKIYKDIQDMIDYVYNSSEGRNFEMKNRNQEGTDGSFKN